MNSVYELLERIQDILKGEDGQNVFTEYQQTLIEKQNYDLYIIIGIRKLLQSHHIVSHHQEFIHQRLCSVSIYCPM